MLDLADLPAWVEPAMRVLLIAVVAVIAIVWARLPQDELAHPLRDDPRADPDGPDEDQTGTNPTALDGASVE